MKVLFSYLFLAHSPRTKRAISRQDTFPYINTPTRYILPAIQIISNVDSTKSRIPNITQTKDTWVRTIRANSIIGVKNGT